METIKRFGTIAAAFALLSTLAIAASKAERANKYFTIAGTVLQIDKTQRTLLVADRASNQKYLIEVPEGHHDLSHHGGNKDKQTKIAKINRFHISNSPTCWTR